MSDGISWLFRSLWWFDAGVLLSLFFNSFSRVLNEYLISVYEGGDMGGRIFELILKRRHAWKSRPIWNSLPNLRLAKKLSYSISAMSHNFKLIHLTPFNT